jgi:hypothetical protein
VILESKPHAKEWLFSRKLGKRLSIDETALSNGELILFDQQKKQR